jgi:hypothetical protein
MRSRTLRMTGWVLLSWALAGASQGIAFEKASAESQVGRVVDVTPGWLILRTEQGFQVFGRGKELSWSRRPVRRGDRVWIQARSHLERLEILEGKDSLPGLQRELPGQVPLPPKDWTDERGFTPS